MRERVCKNCGGREYKVVGQNMVKCAFCGTLYVDEHASKEEEVLLVGANEISRSFRFEDAVAEFDKILSIYPFSYEAYFGRMLARNKIILYTSKKGASRRPRFFEKIVSVFDDQDYKKAMELAPEERKADFQKVTKRIEKIKKRYEEISSESNYDVIFCVAKEDGKISEKVQKIVENLQKNEIKVYFLQNLTQKEGEEDTFRALETCRTFVLFENSNSGYFEFKHLFDRYLYLTIHKQKTQSSFVVATSEDRMASLPRELAFCKNFVDVNSVNFVQDVEDVVKSEMEKAVKETAKIEKVHLDKTEPQKKEYVDVETISPQELGNYEVENVSIDDQDKIKWIYMVLKNGDFATARDLTAEELKNQPYSSEVLFAQLLAEKGIKTPEDFFASISNFDEKDKIDNILRYASRDFAEHFVDEWEKILEQLNDAEYYVRYLTYLAGFKTPNREHFVQSAQNLAVETLDSELIENVLKCFDANDVERFVSFYFSLAQATDNSKYYQKILEIDPGHAPSNITLFLRKFKTPFDILDYSDTQEVEDVLKYFDDQTTSQFIEKIIDMILPVSFINLEKAQERLDFYLSYISNDQDLTKICVKIAKDFQEKCFFKQAERYLAIAISKDKNNHELYWLLIQVKAHCRTDNELIISNIKVIEMPEWETLLSISDDEHKELYTSIVSKGNLYQGERLPFKPDLLDREHLTAKLKEFLLRNDKILLENEKTEGVEGVAKYYKVQLEPFNIYLKTLEATQEFNSYIEIVDKIDKRLDALDLTLDMSVSVIKPDDRLMKTTNNIKINAEQQEKNAEKRRKIRVISKYLCVFLEFFPLCFAMLLFLIAIISPKDVYIAFSQSFLIFLLIYSIIVALGNFVAYIFLKKKFTLKQKMPILALTVIGILNFVLFCLGFYFPSQIEIENAKEMQVLLKNAPYANFALKNDIDFEGEDWQSCDFYGTLDGQNYQISNINLTGSFLNENGGEIKNLTITLQEVSLQNVSVFGVLASTNSGTIENCVVVGNIEIELNCDAVIGGLVGENSGEITSCESNVVFTINAQSNELSVGGLVGKFTANSLIYQNLANSVLEVSVVDANAVYVGGLVAYTEDVGGEIAQNVIETNISVEGTSENAIIGGIVGYGENASHDNRVSGTILTSDDITNGYVGGLYGQFMSSSLQKQVQCSYSQMQITTDLTCGSLVGGWGGTISSCFAVQTATSYNLSGTSALNTLLARMSNCENVSSMSDINISNFNFDDEIWNSDATLKWEN